MKRGIITYDISRTRERNKIAKLLAAYCNRIQFSVFEFELRNDIFNELFNKIATMFKEYKINSVLYKKHNNVYSIRIYFLCDSCIKKSYSFENKKTIYEIEGNIY